MFKISIKIKLFFITISILVVAVILTANINILRFKSLYIEALLERARADANDMKQGISQGLAYFSLDNFSDMTGFLKKYLHKNFSYAFVADNNKIILYHTDPQQKQKPLQKLVYKDVIFDDKTSSHIVLTGNFYETVVPLIKDFEVVGTVHIGIEKKIVDDKIMQMIVQTIILLCLFVFIAVLVMYLFLKRNITDPISKLENKTISISKSLNLPIYDEKRKGDEIEEFSNSFDKMTEEIKAKTLALEEDIEKRKITEKKLTESYEELEVAFEGSIQAIATAVESRDPYTAGHQQRVAALSVAISEKMGFKEKELKQIYFAAMSHDIGKIGVPIDILTKKGKLTEEEFDNIKRHPQTGYEILQKVDFHWPLAEIVRQHHERINGRGYPQGLKGDKMLLESKIIAVADVMEAISKARPYREALGDQVALDEIKKFRGEQFDPDVVDACVEVYEKDNFSFDNKKQEDK